jgi:hypothetical protein
MGRRPAVLSAVLIVAVSLCSALGAQRPTPGVIDGVVSDTGLAPLADVTVTIVGTELRVVTAANGRFRIASVRAGDYMLLVRRVGFEATTARVTVAEHDTLRLSFALEPAVTSLDTVAVAARSVSPRLQEFYDRRKVGPGQFLTQAEIDRINPVRTSDLFTRFLGIAVTDDGSHGYSTRTFMRFSPGKSPKCEIIAIVDGVAKNMDYRRLPPAKDIAGVEFFAGPSEIPLQYKSTDGTWCGLLLIWTRDGSR